DKSPLGNLLHDFLCSDPNDKITPEMADRTRYFKETPKGVAYMSKIMEDFKKEAVMENAKEIALNLLKAGQTVTFTSTMTKLTFDFVKQLAIDNNIPYTI
ncbi:MAG: hypothetical protein IJ583_08670, partial [Firmicutes bacterium]|nr:hypothetical protein [Bacillota bacterium]